MLQISIPILNISLFHDSVSISKVFINKLNWTHLDTAKFFREDERMKWKTIWFPKLKTFSSKHSAHNILWFEWLLWPLNKYLFLVHVTYLKWIYPNYIWYRDVIAWLLYSFDYYEMFNALIIKFSSNEVFTYKLWSI